MKNLWWVSGPKWTFVLEEEHGIVTMAAPISKWALGKPIQHVLSWWKRRGADKVENLAARP